MCLFVLFWVKKESGLAYRERPAEGDFWLTVDYDWIEMGLLVKKRTWEFIYIKSFY